MEAVENKVKKLAKKCSMCTRWSDMDALGHVNNSKYLTYFEQARLEWLLEIAPNCMDNATIGPVIVNAFCTYLKPIHHPQEFDIYLYSGEPGRSSFEMYYELKNLEGDQLFATGSTKVVWVDYNKGKSCPLPENIKELLI